MAVIDPTSVSVEHAGWYPDPEQRHNLRYFDGQDWTDHVTHYGPTPCGGCAFDNPALFES